MLKVRDLKVFGLAPLSFELDRGDILVVRGPSGSGKSLLLRAIADLDEAEGLISLDDRKRQQMTASQWRTMVRYLSDRSGWWLERVDEHFTDLATAHKLAEQLELPTKLFKSPVTHLSSGERQRMSFIRTIEKSPAVLLLDEPTSALDEHSADLMEKKILELNDEGVILVIVTHNDAQADRLSTRVLTIEGGQARLSVA